MNLTSLFYFTVLAQEKSFTRAAKLLHVTQQSLSAHIAAVEKELGCSLVVRHIPLELTYGGQIFLKYAQAIERNYEDMLREFGDITRNQQGILRIGIAFTRGRVVLPPIVAAFQQQFPKVEVQLMERQNKVLQEDLLRDRSDLAIGYFQEEDSKLDYELFYEEEVVLVLPKAMVAKLNLPLAEVIKRTVLGNLQDLENVPFILGSQEDIAGSLGRELLRQVGFQPWIAARSYNVETMLALCREQVGACFCPRNLVVSTLPEYEQYLVLLPLGAKAKMPIRFAWKKQVYPWQVLITFRNIARSCKGIYRQR